MKILTLFALKSETQGLFENYEITYTGVGKVNATYSLTKSIYEQKPDIVLNFGTAGSKKFNYGELVLCDKFIQRDMNAMVFGYENFVTPAEDTPKIIQTESDKKIISLFENFGICGTGDSFETHITGSEEYNIVDMEAYCYAKICQKEKIPFICVKFISDGADNNAPAVWNESLVIGANKMFVMYNTILEIIK